MDISFYKNIMVAVTMVNNVYLRRESLVIKMSQVTI